MSRGRRAEKEERTPQAASLKCRELPFCEFMSETFFPEMRSHLSVGDYLKRTCFVAALMCCSPAVPVHTKLETESSLQGRSLRRKGSKPGNCLIFLLQVKWEDLKV